MNGRLATVLVVLAVTCVTRNSALAVRQAQNVDALVAQHYPQALNEEALEIQGFESRNQCYAMLETSTSGAPQVLIAGYTNLLSGAVLVLRAAAGGFEVAAKADIDELTGWKCEAETLDVDNDGRKDAVVHFLTRNVSADWVFRWDGQNLSNLTPMTTDALGLRLTELINAGFVDVDGDDLIEAFSSPAPTSEGPPLPGRRYRLVGGTYVLERPVAHMQSFERASGAPRTDTDTILLPAGAVGPFTLRIVNGAGTTGSGKRVENAVESGRVWWNGQEIVSPNHFGNHIAVIERTVTLQTENELKVRLGGSPGGRIVVMIDAASWRP